MMYVCVCVCVYEKKKKRLVSMNQDMGIRSCVYVLCMHYRDFASSTWIHAYGLQTGVCKEG